MFRFALGAAVILATSLPVLLEQKRQDEEDRAKDRLAEAGGGTMTRPVARLRAFTPIERGTVIGRGEYLHAEPSYLVRYRAGDGRQVEEWLGQSALETDPDATSANGEGEERAIPKSDRTSPGVAASITGAGALATCSTAPEPAQPLEVRIVRYGPGDGGSTDITIPLG